MTWTHLCINRSLLNITSCSGSLLCSLVFCFCGFVLFVLVYVFVSQDWQSKLRLQPTGLHWPRMAAQAICNKDLSVDPQHSRGHTKNSVDCLSDPASEADLGQGRGGQREDGGQACLRGYESNHTNHCFWASFSPTQDQITHKMDELELQITTNHLIRNCCVMIITETWLHTLIPDAVRQEGQKSIGTTGAKTVTALLI